MFGLRIFLCKPELYANTTRGGFYLGSSTQGIWTAPGYATAALDNSKFLSVASGGDPLWVRFPRPEWFMSKEEFTEFLEKVEIDLLYDKGRKS